MDRQSATTPAGSVAAGDHLRGRTAEIEAVTRVLDDVRAGRGADVVAVVGEAGIGKSALLERAAAAARGMRVLRCVGAPSEAALPFAGLLQMVRPLFGLIERLPAPQAAAARGVFGLSSDRVEDRFLISVAILSLLSEAAEEVPLICIVDEVRWLDHESADALAFVARRIEVEPIAFLVVLGDEDERRFAVPNAVRIPLGPLGDTDALGVVQDVAPPSVSPVVASRIVDAAGGVPLLLKELVALLRPEQLDGRAPLPDALPVSVRIEELFVQRMRELTEESRTALLVAAAAEPGNLKTIADALRLLGHDEDALDVAERAGLIELVEPVRFSHPAVRLAAYASASSTERRRVHGALASVLVEDADDDRRVWHRSAATLGQDEVVAEELERTAGRAAARSGCMAAAAALERAAELSAYDTGQGRRLARAAEMAWLGGQGDRAIALAVAAETASDEAVTRARADFVRGAWETQHGVSSDAVPILLRSAEAVESVDAKIALRSLVAAMMVMWLTGRRASREELGTLERLAHRASADADGGLTSIVEVHEWIASGSTGPAPRLARDISSLAERLEDPVFAPFAAAVPAYLGDLDEARVGADRVVRRVRARGALGMLPFALRQLAGLDVWARRLDDARIHATEGVHLGTETGNPNVVLVQRAMLATVAAIRGEAEACREEAEAALRGAIERSNRDAIAWANLALGHLELALGRPDASDRFDAIWAQPRVGESWLIGAADGIEAAIRSEHRDAAESRLADLECWTTQTGAPWSRPLVARCHALLATGLDAERRFEEALSLHEASGSPFDRARTQLLFGEFLRRARRRADARSHLRQAVETFASIGSALWEERARNELRATGEVLRRRDPEAIWQLTPQELQIARLVAQGASNRDAASELFLSPRTVEYHLRKVFTKLGISSRAELLRMQLDAQAATA